MIVSGFYSKSRWSGNKKMIGHDERMALVIMKDGLVKDIIHLGHVTLESGEMDRLQILLESRGFRLYLTDLSEAATFAGLYNHVQQIASDATHSPERETLTLISPIVEWAEKHDLSVSARAWNDLRETLRKKLT